MKQCTYKERLTQLFFLLLFGYLTSVTQLLFTNQLFSFLLTEAKCTTKRHASARLNKRLCSVKQMALYKLYFLLLLLGL